MTQAVPHADIADYYDGWTERLHEDFQVRNLRVVLALGFARAALVGARSILDVGCGIGWSSWAMSSSGAAVTGVDISPANISMAQHLFGGVEGLSFEVADFTGYQPGRYEAVLMIDVYEHFAAGSRPHVHERIRATGAQRVALTFPTPQTQQYARDHGIPLQPIDEDITDDVLHTLATDLDGRLVLDETVEVWRPGDYRHILIQR